MKEECVESRNTYLIPNIANQCSELFLGWESEAGGGREARKEEELKCFPCVQRNTIVLPINWWSVLAHMKKG